MRKMILLGSIVAPLVLASCGGLKKAVDLSMSPPQQYCTSTKEVTMSASGAKALVGIIEQMTMTGKYYKASNNLYATFKVFPGEAGDVNNKNIMFNYVDGTTKVVENCKSSVIQFVYINNRQHSYRYITCPIPDLNVFDKDIAEIYTDDMTSYKVKGKHRDAKNYLQKIVDYCETQ